MSRGYLGYATTLLCCLCAIEIRYGCTQANVPSQALILRHRLVIKERPAYEIYSNKSSPPGRLACPFNRDVLNGRWHLLLTGKLQSTMTRPKALLSFCTCLASARDQVCDILTTTLTNTDFGTETTQKTTVSQWVSSENLRRPCFNDMVEIIRTGIQQ